MKTGFKNPIEPKNSKQMKSPFNFNQPTYDERSSCYINAGSHYGVGKTQPVGREGNAMMEAECLPKGRVDTLKVSERPVKNLDLEIEQ
jgi:hypothetical protein